MLAVRESLSDQGRLTVKTLQRSAWLIAAISGLLVIQPASAQTTQRTTTGGTGTSGFGATGGSSGGLSGSNAFGGGTNRFSTTNANTASAGQSVLLNQQSSFGLQGAGQQNGMVGARNTQQFLGANQAAQQNQQQNQNRNRNNRGRQNQGMDPNDPNGMNQQGQNDSRRSIRPQQKVDFEVPKIPYEELNTTLNSRFERVTRQPALRNVTVDFDADGVVVLRGEVTTHSQKQLAANMVRLEPGVKKVRNELTLAEPATKP